jgi:citrate synthase
MAELDLLTARQAAERLGIKLDTLYAYVSRGRLQSVSLPGSRERRYRVEDVETLLAAREGERPVRSTETKALMPVIGSSICLIENGRRMSRPCSGAPRKTPIWMPTAPMRPPVACPPPV